MLAFHRLKIDVYYSKRIRFYFVHRSYFSGLELTSMGFICVAELFSILCCVCLRSMSYFKRISFFSKYLFFGIEVDEYMCFSCVVDRSSFLCCVVFLCFVLCLSSSYVLCSMFPMSLDCPFLIAPSIFSDVYLICSMYASFLRHRIQTNCHMSCMYLAYLIRADRTSCFVTLGIQLS